MFLKIWYIQPHALYGDNNNMHNSLSTTACTSDDIFAIVHALLDRVDDCARPPMFLISLTLYPAKSAETLTHSHIENRMR